MRVWWWGGHEEPVHNKEGYQQEVWDAGGTLECQCRWQTSAGVVMSQSKDQGSGRGRIEQSREIRGCQRAEGRCCATVGAMASDLKRSVAIQEQWWWVKAG